MLVVLSKQRRFKSAVISKDHRAIDVTFEDGIERYPFALGDAVNAQLIFHGLHLGRKILCTVEDIDRLHIRALQMGECNLETCND